LVNCKVIPGQTFTNMDAMIGNLHEVDIRRLRIFMTIVERGGFVQAQNELGISASTISVRMSELEDKLGLRLCQRGRAGFSVTPEGEAVYDACQSLLIAHETFISSIGSARGVISGELRIGIIDNTIFDPNLSISRLISRFREQTTDVEISLYTMPPTELERALVEQRLHLAIGVFYQRIPGLVYQLLCQERLLLYCAKQHAFFADDTDGPTLDQLKQAEFIERTYGQTTSRLNQAVEFKPGAYASSLEATALLILSGKYIGFLPHYYANNWVDSGQLKPLLETEIYIDSEISIVTHKNPQNQSMTAKLLEVVRETMI